MIVCERNNEKIMAAEVNVLPLTDCYVRIVVNSFLSIVRDNQSRQSYL